VLPVLAHHRNVGASDGRGIADQGAARSGPARQPVELGGWAKRKPGADEGGGESRLAEGGPPSASRLPSDHAFVAVGGIDPPGTSGSSEQAHGHPTKPICCAGQADPREERNRKRHRDSFRGGPPPATTGRSGAAAARPRSCKFRLRGPRAARGACAVSGDPVAKTRAAALVFAGTAAAADPEQDTLNFLAAAFAPPPPMLVRRADQACWEVVGPKVYPPRRVAALGALLTQSFRIAKANCRRATVQSFAR